MAASPMMRRSFALLLCSAALTGCSGPSDAPAGTASAPPPPGQIVVVNHGLDAPPPQDESTVLAPAALKPDETLVVESPPLQEGVPQPLTPAVATPTGDAEADRIALLEKEVAALRADYNAMMPAFNGLITTNERIKNLLDQLEQKAGVAPAPAKAETIPAPQVSPAATAAEKPQAAAPAPASGTVTATGLRVGEHGDKTRLVLDVSALTDYKTATDNDKDTLIITLPGAAWSGKAAADGIKSKLVSGWTAQAAPDGGTQVAIRLKKDVKIVASERLKAEGTGTARLVFDLAADKPAS